MRFFLPGLVTDQFQYSQLLHRLVIIIALHHIASGIFNVKVTRLGQCLNPFSDKVQTALNYWPRQALVLRKNNGTHGRHRNSWRQYAWMPDRVRHDRFRFNIRVRQSIFTTT